MVQLLVGSTPLSLAMFFSPCLEIDAYFFAAGMHGVAGIAAVAAVYLIVTVLAMMLLIDLGGRGIERIKRRFLEHHEHSITGAVLILLGVAAFFIHV